MNSIGKAKVGVGVVLVAAAAGVLASAGGPATAGQVASNHGDVAKIKMVQKGRDLTFTGPKEVEKGAKLRIVNDTNPKKVGPHTFTLITSKNMPTSKKKQKKCEELEGVCGDIAAAHKFDPKTNKVNKPSVDAGKKGWDKPFGTKGDSWYTEKNGTIAGRKVTAKPGTVLRFFCVVHPFMKGKIKVVK